MSTTHILLATLSAAVFYSGDAHGLTVAAIEEETTRSHVRDSVNQRVEAESAARSAAKAKAADKDSIILALKAAKRREAARDIEVYQPPFFTAERIVVIGMMTGLPLMLLLSLRLLTARSMRLRDRERLAMTRTFLPKPSSTEAPPRPAPKIPLAQFLASNKEKYQKLSGEFNVPAPGSPPLEAPGDAARPVQFLH